MYKDLKALHPGGNRTRDLLFYRQADAMTTMPRRQGLNDELFTLVSVSEII
jgi:hypothetical protein